MGKEKSIVSTKNNRRKSFLFHTDDKPVNNKPSKRLVSHHKKQSNTEFSVDSLECLRDMTKRKKLNAIDEKIKLLKTELKTLLHDKASDKIYACSTDASNNSKSNDLPCSHNFNQLKPVLGSELKEFKENCEDFDHLQIKKKNFQPISSSTPCKFSEELKKAGDKKIDLTEKSVQPAVELKSNIFNVSSISQHKVEQLLYESFVMQNSELNLSFSEESDSELGKCTKTIKENEFQKSKKQSKNYNKKFTYHNSYKYNMLTQKRKKRRMSDTNSVQSDLEVINLDSSSCNNLKTKNDTVCINLDVKDCNWNEPFDLDNTTVHSELEILERCEKKETAVNEGLKLNSTNLIETESFNNENKKTQLKRVWECPVCFEQSKGQEVVATQCGHVFCKKCLENHFSVLSESCPSCRADLKNKPFITLFNF